MSSHIKVSPDVNPEEHKYAGPRPPRNLPTQYKEAAVSAASERKRYRNSRGIARKMGLLERRILEVILH